MGKKWFLAAALTTALGALAGCGGSTLNSYLLEDAAVGGDSAKSLKPVRNLLVWPLDNIAPSSKAKGIEPKLTSFLIDAFYLRGKFDRVVIVEEDQAKDLMTRAGEELGLKKKPKVPLDGALVTSKLGQLTGTEAILVGRLEDYDEEKVDKATYTVVAASFNLLDAREKAYATLDSFTPVKRIWRMNAKRAVREGAFSNRESLDEAVRSLWDDVVDRLSRDMARGMGEAGREQERRVAELRESAEKSLAAGDYDKATATWNEVLKVDPENKDAKKKIEEISARKKEAQEKDKAAALQKQVGEILGRAAEREKAGDAEGAIEQYKKVLDLDKNNKEAAQKLEAHRAAVDEKKSQETEKEKSARLYQAQENLKAMKYRDAIADARKVLELEPDNAKAKEIIAAAERKLGELPAEAAPKAATPAAAPAPKKAEEPAAAPSAGGGDLEGLRNEAMAAFNKEDYAASRDLWKQILETAPEDKQAKEMLETTEMLLNALK